MDSNRNSRVGEIVLLDYPYTNAAGSKVRPVVIIAQSAGRHCDLTVAFVTSEVKSYCDDDAAVVFDAGDLTSGVIHKQSVIRVDKVLVIEEAKIKHPNIARLSRSKLDELMRAWARIMVTSHFDSVHSQAGKKAFFAGDRIPYAARVFDEKEISALVDASLDFWLTTGRYAEQFEKEFAEFLGIKHCTLVNSGSSANLLAFMALTSPKLGDRRIKRGDEVITVAAAFPTTVAPIIQYGAIPVFVDVELPSYNIDCAQLDKALSEKSKAVMLAHTLGNPFDLKRVREFCDQHHLWLIEDNCDSLGSKYKLNGKWRYTGTFGDIGTSSFYPAHHMTMGEGGAVYTNDAKLKRLVESFRDWGRDCWCASGHDNTCGRRFGQQFGELPPGYDHKYVYSHFGYNLKTTDMQAAVGCAQLAKLPGFIAARKRNWQLLRDGLADLSDIFMLPQPAANSDSSWFGFLLTVRDGAIFTRDAIINRLETKGIQTRMLFAGNLIKHPCFDELRKEGRGYSIVGELTNTDRIMRDAFWIGVYPGMTEQMISYMVSTIHDAVGRSAKKL
ncbi:MAG: lipopolysaccharide biosynthesis protein RfbH [Verrucomicrobia bacterium]|nr:lipopolysaccharide biosynthesis protein RfbH [Verrucomicrobiota bacterium]